MNIMVPSGLKVEIEITHILLELPVRYGTEDIPEDFPLRKGDMWRGKVELETGRLLEWPKGREARLFLKVVDGGIYTLLDPQGTAVACLNNDYVPHGVVPGEYGDYVDLNINGDGRITNWPKQPDVEAFFPEPDRD